jgi:hypothetical protein
MGVGGQRHAPAALPPGKTQYPLYRRLGGPQSQSGKVQKISSPPGFDPQTVKSVATRYTDWAIPATIHSLFMLDMQLTNWQRTGLSPDTFILYCLHLSTNAPYSFFLIHLLYNQRNWECCYILTLLYLSQFFITLNKTSNVPRMT